MYLELTATYRYSGWHGQRILSPQRFSSCPSLCIGPSPPLVPPVTPPQHTKTHIGNLLDTSVTVTSSRPEFIHCWRSSLNGNDVAAVLSHDGQIAGMKWERKKKSPLTLKQRILQGNSTPPGSRIGRRLEFLPACRHPTHNPAISHPFSPWKQTLHPSNMKTGSCILLNPTLSVAACYFSKIAEFPSFHDGKATFSGSMHTHQNGFHLQLREDVPTAAVDERTFHVFLTWAGEL